MRKSLRMKHFQLETFIRHIVETKSICLTHFELQKKFKEISQISKKKNLTIYIVVFNFVFYAFVFIYIWHFIDPSGQILSLCDQINRQSTRSEAAQVTNLPGPTSSGFVTNNPQSHNFNQNFQSSFQSVQQQVQQPPQPISQPPQFARMYSRFSLNTFYSIVFFLCEFK